MNKNIKHNNYRIDEENEIAIFDTYTKSGYKNGEFIVYLEDFDTVYPHRWYKNIHVNKGTNYTINSFIDGKNVDIMRVITQKYINNDGTKLHTLIRVNSNKFDFRKVNILASNSKGDAYLNRFTTNTKRRSSLARKMAAEYAHVTVKPNRDSMGYTASIGTDRRFSPIRVVSKTFTESKVNHARERAIYAAYLFEKEYCGNDFPTEEYRAKELAFASLTDGERAEVEDAIVDQLGTLKVARKNAQCYLKGQTLAAKLASGEIIVRPDWKISNVEESEDAAIEIEPEPELAAVDYTIKCSKHLLNSAHQKRNTDEFVHVNHAVLKSGSRWVSVGSLPKRNNIFNVTFTEGNYTDAKAMAIYSAYLFEKLVYGDNFPKTEYNRKLEVIKTLSTKEIEFVNTKVDDKLEKVYTILKESASEKSNACEPPQEVDAEKSADEFLEQIKQTPLKDDALETAAVDDELFAERFKRIEIPERNKLAIQQAIAEMKQKPSLFQRIKNWFAN